MQNEELQQEIEKLRAEVVELESALGKLNWKMWDFQRTLPELATMASKLVGQIDPDVVSILFRKALLDVGVANEVDILYPADGIFQTKPKLSKIDIVLASKELEFIPAYDEPVPVTQGDLPSLKRWDSFKICWAIRLRELEATTRAVSLIWREKAMLDPDIQIIKTFALMCRMAYGARRS